jgi:hypothetical protein
MAETPDQRLQRLQNEAKAKQAYIDLLEQESDKLSQQLVQNEKLEQAKINLRIAQEELNQATKNGSEEDIKAAAQKRRDAEKNLKNIQDQVDETNRLTKAIRDANDAARDLGDSFANVFGGEGAIQIDNFVDGVINISKNIGAMISQKKGLGEFLNSFATASLTNFANAVFQMALNLADAEDLFMRATGANREFARSVTNSYSELGGLGFSIDQVSQSYQQLYTDFTDFTMLSQTQRESLAETSTVLERMGISNQAFAQSVQLSTKALGMSAEQAGQNMLDLEKFAEELGVAPQQLADDFVGAGGALAKLGQDGTQAFKDLAIAAKTTGLSIQTIVNLVEKFDTFEGAAQQAGQLNAALGGNFVNAMDLMMATNPAERFEMIRDSLLDTGLSFDEMSYYQRNFFKESLGLSDVGELAALMSGDMDLVAGATNETSQSLIEAKERAAELATAQESLNALLVEITPKFIELVKIIHSFTEAMIENRKTIKNVVYGLGIFLVAIKGIMLALNVRKLLGFGAAAAGAGAGAAEGSVGVQMMGAAAKISAKQMLAFGAAVIMVGAGIALAALGLAQMIAAFEGLNGGAIIGAVITIGLVVAGLYLLIPALLSAGTAAAASSLPLLAAGAAILMMGAAIGIAAAGLGVMISAMAELGNVSGTLIVLPVILTQIAGAMSLMGNPLALGGMMALTAVFTSMGFAAKFMGAETAESFEKITKAISSVPTRKNIEFRSYRPQQITINVMVDRQKLATVVRQINGEDALNSVSGRG